jgi:hypothetical protein
MTNYAPQVIVLSGTKTQMGFRYGELMADRLRQAYEILINFYVNENHIPFESVASKAQVFYNKYPHSYQQFLQAEARGANLTLEQINIINGMETLNSLVKVQAKDQDTKVSSSESTCASNSTASEANSMLDGEISGCAFISVPSIKTVSGGNLIGRNYDFFAPFDQMAKFLTVTVLNEPDYVPTAFVGFVGQIFCATCINQKGLFVEFNNGMPSGGFKTDHSVESLLINLLQITQDSSSFNQFDSQISAIRADYSLVVNVANRTHAKAFEFSAEQKIMMETNFTEIGIVASTNSFSHPAWEKEPTNDECWLGHSRRDNLASQAQQRSVLAVNDLMEVLDVNLEQGGGKWDYTLYQVIFNTPTMELFVRPTVQSSNWCAVNLNKAFSENFAQELSGVVEAGYCSVIM